MTKYGFKGAMIHGLTNGVFHDDKRFWPIYERAQALDVPIYIHPAFPHPAVVEAYYKDYVARIPDHRERRLGLYRRDRDPGHPHDPQRRFRRLSEAARSFSAISARACRSMSGASTMRFRAPGNKADRPSAMYFCEHFYVTTSGFFSDPALQCCITELGIDRIMFSVDYPFVENKPGTEWINALSLNAADKEKILSGNAKRLLRL